MLAALLNGAIYYFTYAPIKAGSELTGKERLLSPEIDRELT